MPTALAESREGVPGRAAVRPERAASFRRARTTPGLLRICSVVLVIGIAGLWLAGWTSASRRYNRVHAIGARTEPLIVEAQQIHASLSEADASAAGVFLAGDAESPADQARYEQGIAAASKELSSAAQRGESSAEARGALLTVTQQLPVYTGLVAQAWALNRQNLPLGAAYLRDASKLMQTTILPATDKVADVNAGRLDRAYRDATRGSDVPVLLVALGTVVAGLIAAQVLLFSRSHRILNVALVVATVVLVGTVLWTAGSFSSQRSEMVKARDRGYVPSSLLSRARVLAFRADGDQSLSVIARGNGAQFDTDFNVALAGLGYPPGGGPTTGVLSGLLHSPAAADVEGQVGSAATAIQEYAGINAKVRQAVAGASFTGAVELVQGRSASSFGRFDANASQALASTQHRFDTGVAAAERRVRDLALVMTAAALLAGILVVAGLQRRIREYR